MNFIQAAIETATNNVSSSENTVVVATDAIQTINPSTGVVSNVVDFVSDNKKAIAVTAAAAATVYIGVKYLVPAVRRAFAKETTAKADLNKAKAAKHTRTRDEEVLMMEFKKAHHSTVLSVPFDAAWNNGTGYLNGATNAELNLKPGQYFKSTCPTSNRKVIGKVIAKGKNIVVFERYTPAPTAAFKLVANLPDGVNIPEMMSILTLDTFHNFMDGKI